MTVPTDSGDGTPYVSYTGDGTTTAFPVPFTFDSNIELEVIERVTASGAETVKTLTTHYTVSGGSGSTGTVTAVSAPASTVQWHIRRKTLRSQTDDFVSADAFPASTFEGRLDKLTRQVQDVWELAGRAIRFKRTEHPTAELDQKSTRAGRVVGFDSSGNLTTYDPVEGADDPDDGLASLGAARQATVLLVRDSVPATDTSPDFALYDIDGARQSLSSSTTDGLAEALALVAATADNLKVSGAGRVNPGGVSKGSLVLTTALTMPALDCVNVDLQTAIVSTDHATLGSGDAGVTVDSFALATMRLIAQFTGDHAGPVLRFNPATNGGGDANKQIGVAHVECLGAINNITSSGSKAIDILASDGTNISRSMFHFWESNGGEIGVDIRCTGSGTIHGNHFDLFGGHDYGTTGYQVGVTGGSAILGCTFDIRNYGASGGTYGLRVGTTRCRFSYNNDGNAQTTEVSIESGATKNDIHLLRWDGTIADASDKSNAIHMPGRWIIEVDRNGVDQTTIADNTFTKVQHTTERYDTYAAFDNATNYRATITVPGWYDVEVGSAWVTGEDGLEVHNAIYVNGSVKRSVSGQVGGAAGNIGGPPLRCMLYLAKDDYVEHFVLHNGTGTRDLLGASARTYMIIRRLD
jgi:hypothetical protein